MIEAPIKGKIKVTVKSSPTRTQTGVSEDDFNYRVSLLLKFYIQYSKIVFVQTMIIYNCVEGHANKQQHGFVA